MTASAHLEHLQLLHLLSRALPLGADAAVPAAALPASVATTHYGADGREISATSETSYAGLTLSADGQITGGSITHATASPSGKPVNRANIAFTATGAAGSVHSVVENRFAAGPFKTVEVDLTGVQWTPAQSIHAGQIAITARDVATNAVRLEGRLSFGQEALQAGTFAHRAWAGDGKVHNYTDVDYTPAKLVGMRLTGGHCAITFRDAASTVLSRSALFVRAEGTVDQIHTQTFDPATGAQKTLVTADFGSVVFGPAGHVQSGSASFTVTSPAGALRSRTSATFAAGVPRQTVTETFANDKPGFRIVTDYSRSRFNNDLAVVDSDVVALVHNAAGTLIAITTSTFGAKGNLKSRRTERMHKKTGAVFSTTIADYTSAHFDYRGTPIGGFVTLTTTEGAGTGRKIVSRQEITPAAGTPEPKDEGFDDDPPTPGKAPRYRRRLSTVTDAAGAVVARTQRITRADGTLLRMTQTNFAGEVPTSSIITDFSPDGTAIVAIATADLTGLTVDPDSQRVTGRVGVAQKFRGVTPSSSSVLSFAGGA